MNQFVARVANWLANEVIVKSLVRNKGFQNMAMRTHLRVEKTKEIAKEAMEEAADVVEKEVLKASTSQAGKKEASALKPPPRGGFGGFLEAFAKEVKKDLG